MMDDRPCRYCDGVAKYGRVTCNDCHIIRDRICRECGVTYHGRARLACLRCRKAAEKQLPAQWVCRDCGTGHRGRVGCATCVNRARTARLIAARVDGPVPASTYRAIRESGLCVYCGGGAEAVDHVMPLYRGGPEHPDNLVPVCRPCNSSKGDRLLVDWDQTRVAHAVAASPKVAAAYAAQSNARGLTKVCPST